MCSWSQGCINVLQDVNIGRVYSGIALKSQKLLGQQEIFTLWLQQYWKISRLQVLSGEFLKLFSKHCFWFPDQQTFTWFSDVFRSYGKTSGMRCSVLCPLTYIWMSQNTNVTLSKKTHELWLKKWRFLGSLAYEFLRLYIQKALLPSGNACF